MDDPGEAQNSTAGSKAKIFTAIQHGSGLVAVLGLFLTISAISTGRNPGMVTAGLIMTALGAIGFLAGRAAARRNRIGEKKIK